MRLPRSRNGRISTFMRKTSPGSGGGTTHMVAPARPAASPGKASSGLPGNWSARDQDTLSSVGVGTGGGFNATYAMYQFALHDVDVADQVGYIELDDNGAVSIVADNENIGRAGVYSGTSVGAATQVFVHRFGDRAAAQAGIFITPTLVFLSMSEAIDPGNPAAGIFYLFAKDNGAGKMQLCVRFPTGAAIVLATEP